MAKPLGKKIYDNLNKSYKEYLGTPIFKQSSNIPDQKKKKIKQENYNSKKIVIDKYLNKDKI